MLNYSSVTPLFIIAISNIITLILHAVPLYFHIVIQYLLPACG